MVKIILIREITGLEDSRFILLLAKAELYIFYRE